MVKLPVPPMAYSSSSKIVLTSKSMLSMFLKNNLSNEPKEFISEPVAKFMKN